MCFLLFYNIKNNTKFSYYCMNNFSLILRLKGKVSTLCNECLQSNKIKYLKEMLKIN